MKNSYDVIIIGAGIAGLECAKHLAGSGLSILIVEKNNSPGSKVCAEGVVLQDLKYVSKEDLNFDFQKLIFHYKNKTKAFPDNDGIISTINRKTHIKRKIDQLKKIDNIEFLIGNSVAKIVAGNSLELSSGEIIRFKYLVGADGSISVVRKYLNLPSEKIEIAMQYILPKKFNDFEIYLDSKNLGTGYLWIFPNKDYDSIGCGGDLRYMNVQKMKAYFELWLKEKNINFSKENLQAALINYDYRGYKFNNIFLAGDAAGLASGILGKGIYSAFLSGEQIANEILNKPANYNLIERWLKKKRKQEFFMVFMKNKIIRNLAFNWGIKSMRFQKIQKLIMRGFIR